jgi:nucleoside-diphosphate-sugar epimerase
MTALHVLVTGATGKLGRAVCGELAKRGHRVRASDVKFGGDLGVELLLGDLGDEPFVYRALKDCNAVVHLGNHPSEFAGPSRQRILADNSRMNANVVYAAMDLGLSDIVFASSIQVMLSSIGNSPPPYRIPYLPIDGKAPRNPGTNSYALSKELCERLMEEACRAKPELAATALRFPMLVGGEFLDRMRDRKAVSARWLNLGEALAYLALSEAAELVALVLEKRRAGYRQYLPAMAQLPTNLTLSELIQRFYADIPLKKPLSEIAALIDVSELEREYGWVPKEPLPFTLEEA